MTFPVMSPAYRLGVIWVLCLFSVGSIGPLFVDYGRLSGVGGWLCIGGVAAFVGFCLISVQFWLSQLTGLRLPERWYRLRSSETQARYRRLGVAEFRRALLRSPFRFLNRDVHLQGGSHSDLEQLDLHMRAAETNHAIAFLLTLFATLLYGTVIDGRFVPWFVALNILGNLYPALMQRFNRLRVARLLVRLGSRVSSHPRTT